MNSGLEVVFLFRPMTDEAVLVLHVINACSPSVDKERP